MSTPTAEPEKEKAPRKFPAPCWTQDEALSLIEAYRERWYALRRGYLRTADWDAVAASVGERCPDSSPPKTSAQCRHKMEKLRQRYRAEKQRSLSFPGKFFSTWFFFENMDAMELGTTPGDRSSQPTVDSERKPKKGKKIGAISNPNHVPDLDSGEFQSNAIVVRNPIYRPKSSSKTDPFYGSRVSNGNPMYMDVESDPNEDSDDDDDDDDEEDDDDDVGYRTRAQIDANLAPPVLRAKKMGKGHGNFGGHNHVDQEMTPTGYRSNRSSKLNPNFGGVDVRFDPKMQRFRTKGSGSNDRYSSPNTDSRSGYGFPPNFGSGVGKKRGDKGVKRDRGEGLGEIVSSIKMLGDGFMKMETMKIEMAREIEKMRMEMETKRNEMILESQKQIVDAFMSVLVENKKTKKAANPEVPLDT